VRHLLEHSHLWGHLAVQTQSIQAKRVFLVDGAGQAAQVVQAQATVLMEAVLYVAALEAAVAALA